MNNFKHRLKTNWPFLILAITTALVGLNFLVNPGILDDRSAYAFIVNVLDDAVVSIPMIVSGTIGIVTFILGWSSARALLLVFYQFIWVTLCLAFLWRALNGYPNSSWIMALSISAMIFLVALWGDTDG